MLKLLAEIVDTIADLVGLTNKVGKWFVLAILAWAMPLVALSLCTDSWIVKGTAALVPAVALVVMFFMVKDTTALFLILASNARTKWVIDKFLMTIAGNTLIGLFLAVIPLSAVPWLVPILILAFIVLLIVGKELNKERVAAMMTKVIVLATLVALFVFLVGKTNAERLAQRAKASVTSTVMNTTDGIPRIRTKKVPSVPSTPYGLVSTVPLPVCGDANAPRYFRKSPTRSFEIDAHEGCASSVFLVPNYPAHINFKEIGGTENPWIQIVTWNGKLIGPIGANDPLWDKGHGYHMMLEHHGEENGFRLVGRGTYLITLVPLSTDAPPLIR